MMVPKEVRVWLCLGHLIEANLTRRPSIVPPLFPHSHISLITSIVNANTVVLERPLPWNVSLLYSPVMYT